MCVPHGLLYKFQYYFFTVSEMVIFKNNYQIWWLFVYNCVCAYMTKQPPNLVIIFVNRQMNDLFLLLSLYPIPKLFVTQFFRIVVGWHETNNNNKKKKKKTSVHPTPHYTTKYSVTVLDRVNAKSVVYEI